MTGPVTAVQKGCHEVPTRPCRPSSLYVSLGMLRAMCLEQAYEQLYSHQTWCGIELCLLFVDAVRSLVKAGRGNERLVSAPDQLSPVELVRTDVLATASMSTD